MLLSTTDDAQVGQIPALDKLLGKNPHLTKFYKFDDFAVAAGYAVERFMERMQNLSEFKDKKDFVNGFLAAKAERPDLVTDNEVIGYMILNILGGADTLAICTKATFYHLLKSPSAKAKLINELRSAQLPSPAPYHALAELPYLDACIKEGLRIHPVIGHILERVVPATGLTLGDGTVLPPAQSWAQIHGSCTWTRASSAPTPPSSARSAGCRARARRAPRTRPESGG